MIKHPKRRARTALTRIAFQIADTSMLELLRSNALPQPVPPGATEQRFALLSNRGRRVRKLAKADPATLQACQLLFARGLARVDGAYVVAKAA